MIIKKEIFDKVGLFNKDFNIIGDFDLVMRMSRKFNGHATNEPLLFYRCHKNNFSKINLEMFFKEFNNWFNDQVKLEDKYFLNNIKSLLPPSLLVVFGIYKWELSFTSALMVILIFSSGPLIVIAAFPTALP